ncbi:MAG TPA: hypothetical protein VL475_07315 [Planctomycetaceae bacterium]|jgi:hypothetical protein|nr:hypothetical protein [Planctomycetaceae bacterium]
MNYFAHGVRFLDRPYFLAGTAIPDWLSVVDRQVRLRAKRVEPFAVGPATPEVELAAGVLQHLRDDAWFHATPAFARVSAELTVLFRGALPADDAHRPSFLGHIVTEMLLDAILIARNPRSLDAYYDTLLGLDGNLIERAVNRMARRTTDRLALFIPLFHRERFLADYQDPARLFVRLNQILRRVKLTPLPPAVQNVLPDAWRIVEPSAGDLLPGAANPLAPPAGTA